MPKGWSAQDYFELVKSYAAEYHGIAFVPADEATAEAGRQQKIAHLHRLNRVVKDMAEKLQVPVQFSGHSRYTRCDPRCSTSVINAQL